MNATSVRPQTKFVAAMVAAGMVSAASIVGVPERQGLPMINADVANASAITDFLLGVGDAVNSASYGLSLSLSAPIRLPFDALAAIAVATQAPESERPALLSWLVQKYVNPAPDGAPYPITTVPEQLLNQSLIPLAEQLPAWLGPTVIDGLNRISSAIGGAFAGAPNPFAGEYATDLFYESDIGSVVLAANRAIAAPVWMLYETAYYLGYLPYDLVASVESAIQDPSEIPGLVSYLAWNLLSSDGLVGNLLYYAARPLMTLPGPIGELSTNLYNTVADGLDNVLSLLPEPVTPTPFATPVPEPESQINSVPDPSLQRGALLLSTDVVEEKVEAPEEPTAETPPVAPQDPAPAAGDVDPGATPAADTGTPEVKPGKPVTNRVKLGNKVRPGEKFTGPAKGDTGKDNDATAPAPVKDGPSDPAGATGSEGGNADGPDNAGGADSDSGAAA